MASHSEIPKLQIIVFGKQIENASGGVAEFLNLLRMNLDKKERPMPSEKIAGALKNLAFEALTIDLQQRDAGNVSQVLIKRDYRHLNCGGTRFHNPGFSIQVADNRLGRAHPFAHVFGFLGQNRAVDADRSEERRVPRA